MSDDKLGYRECYICKSAIPPLVSICWSCGYSQLPGPDGQAGSPDRAGQTAADKASPRDKLRRGLGDNLNKARDTLNSKLGKK